MSDRLNALRAAVAADPDNTALSNLLADLLVNEGQVDEGLDVYSRLLSQGALSGEEAILVANIALGAGRLQEARGCIEHARSSGVVEGLTELDSRLDQALMAQVKPVREGAADLDLPEWRIPEEVNLTFADVGGMDDVKKMLHRIIIMPFVRPELYEKYGRSAGGGVLLYGPPGCGKTMLAKAVAGECGLPFFSIGIDDIVSPYHGQAELNLSAIMQAARDSAPAVVFIDEIDALGYARQRANGEMGRRMTNTLLQELDGVGKSTKNLLVLAASNAPWDIDSALIRPGRFDRRVFVPPPDKEGREEILRVRLRDVETDNVNISALSGASEMFTGADLRAVIERALDEVIESVLETGNEVPVTHADLAAALVKVRPSSLEWLARARDYVEFSNATGQWADVEKYLSSRAVRKRLAGS